MTLRMAHPEQENMEVADLASKSPFPVSTDLLRQMVRRSNPSKVAIALEECRQRYDAVQRRWSPALCRKMVIRIWKQVSGQSAPDAVGADSSAPSRSKELMKTLSKREAAKLLHISESTLLRRMKAGRYQFTRTGSDQYSPLTFTHAQLGLQEPAPPAPVVEPVPVVKPAPVAKPEPAQEPSQVGPTRTFATGWNADRTMFVASDGTIYRRHSSGEMFRSDERLTRHASSSPSAADSCVRHPFSIERPNKPREELGAGAGKAGTVDDPEWKALWRNK